MPLPILPILGGSNAIMQLLSGISGAFGANDPAQQINQYTDPQMQSLTQMFTDAMSQYQAQLGQAQQAQGDMRGTERAMGGVGREIGQVEQPGAMDWYDNWLGAVPGFQQIAGQLADTATEDLGRSIQEQVDLDTQAALTQVQNQFAGSRGGAGAAAAGQAIAAPMAQGRSQMLGQKADIESGTFNQLAGQGMGAAVSGTQGEFQNAMQNLMAQLQGLGAQGQMQGQRGGQALQGAQIAGGLAQGAQQQRTQMADPIYREQANPFAPLATGFGAFADILGTKSYGFPWSGSRNTTNAFGSAGSDYNRGYATDWQGNRVYREGRPTSFSGGNY